MVSPRDDLKQCRRAASQYLSEGMSKLEGLAKEHDKKHAFVHAINPFAAVRHLVGRLAYRVAVCQILLSDLDSISYLLSNFRVLIVELVSPVPSPEVDSHTTLDGILNRLLGKDNPERNDIQNALIRLNDVSSTFRLFMSNFRRCFPRVHAEIQVLEHFFKKNLAFVNNDRYISCSKPACLCCKLYFENHPARMVEPPSHGKVWSNWSPPLISNFRKGDQGSDRQRDILQAIIETLRKSIVKQVLQASQPSKWHADSRTGASLLGQYE